ncbi:hypothetical protein LX36DRAFT_457175 [Colletotrichum falcatum]|nr:hypothetical protein LX36DRAFT_457175 [Colletotrichum falcatum]
MSLRRRFTPHTWCFFSPTYYLMYSCLVCCSSPTCAGKSVPWCLTGLSLSLSSVSLYLFHFFVQGLLLRGTPPSPCLRYSRLIHCLFRTTHPPSWDAPPIQPMIVTPPSASADALLAFFLSLLPSRLAGLTPLLIKRKSSACIWSTSASLPHPPRPIAPSVTLPPLSATTPPMPTPSTPDCFFVVGYLFVLLPILSPRPLCVREASNAGEDRV